DTFGRDTGYAMNGVRQSTLAYDPVTGRLASMQIPAIEDEQNHCPPPPLFSTFQWIYLPGSDLKQSLTYPNGLTASWVYDANNQLLQVCNTTQTNVISQYDYTYDAAGRRVACAKSGFAFTQDDTVAYGYNNRSELTNAVSAVDADYHYVYDFDNIGNREISSEHGTNTVYTANVLNQYVAIDDFVPQFDDDGNQTRIKTATGIWQVQYNGENRPILWTQGTNMIAMSYDRMGRRVTKIDQCFVYDGYLQMSSFELSATNAQLATHNLQFFIWDPSEPIAMRPLVWSKNGITSYYVHDGNKNVSEVVALDGACVAHYTYAPFAAVVSASGTFVSDNTFRFSSEYSDDDIGLVHYNYRQYNPSTGRWMSRDRIGERTTSNLYLFVRNTPSYTIDLYGLKDHWKWVNLPNGSQCKVNCAEPDPPAPRRRAKTCQIADLKVATGEEGAKCKSFLHLAMQDEGVKAIMTKMKVMNCKIPPIECGCCSAGCKGAGAWHISVRKGWGIYICSSAQLNQRSMIEYLKHELTHEIQSCSHAPDGTCLDRMLREIEAYKAGGRGFSCIGKNGECGGAIGGAVWSSCYAKRCSIEDINDALIIAMELYYGE
ncbi:MAG: RHS repeat-associated core domain-containing protein, partial [Prevotellaceae bacterium]|nr:RHS repeat-associated core domain-containing protein [Prevotellaceae bacterium]